MRRPICIMCSSSTEARPRVQESTAVDKPEVGGRDHHEVESSEKQDGPHQTSLFGPVDEDEFPPVPYPSRYDEHRHPGPCTRGECPAYESTLDSEEEDAHFPGHDAPLLGSDRWMTAEELEIDNFEASRFKDEMVNWDELKNVCSKIRNGMSCEFGDRFDIGESSLVRKITFEDGQAWAARVRYTHLGTNNDYYADERGESMVSEVATLRFLKSRTSIPVPEVYGYNNDRENPVGAEYVLVEYIHGTRALDMDDAPSNWESDGLGFAGSGRDKTNWKYTRRFRRQLAAIQTELATIQFDRIGSIFEDPHEPSGYKIGADPRSLHGPGCFEEYEKPGWKCRGPWATSPEYFHSLAQSAIQSIRTGEDRYDELEEDGSMVLPEISEAVMTNRRDPKLDKGPFGLAHRFLGSQTVLVNEHFKVLSLLGVREIMAVPVEMQAQFPVCAGLDFKFPAIKEKSVPRKCRWHLDGELTKYRNMLRKCEQAMAPNLPRRRRPSEWMYHSGTLAYQAILWYDTHEDDIIQHWMKNVLRLLGSNYHPFFCNTI